MKKELFKRMPQSDGVSTKTNEQIFDAILNDDIKKMKKLISKGADLHIEIDGKSLIEWSQYYYSNGEMVELLKAHGL